MADPENTALLSEGGVGPATAPEPTPRTRRLTYAAFGFIVVLALFPLFSGGFAGFFFTLLSFALCGYLSYHIFTRVIQGRVGGTEISRASLLSYVACSVPAGLLILVSSLLLFVLLFAIIGLGLNTFKPRWYTDIGAAASELGKHGELLMDGRPIMQELKRLHNLGRSSGDGILARARFVLPSDSTKSMLVMPTTARILAATTKRILSIGSSLVEKDVSNRGNKLANALVKGTHVKSSSASASAPGHTKHGELVFEDGTKANPLIASLLLSISRIPLLLILFLFIVNAYFFKGYIPERAKQWIAEGYALKQPNATLRSVTASVMALGLGFAVLAAGLSPAPSIFVALSNGLIFWIVARVTMAYAEIIGVISYTNSVSAPGQPKKVAILIPVLISGSIQFLWSLFFVGVIKRVLPAFALLLTSEVASPELIMGSFLWMPIFVIVSGILTAGALYLACRIAYTRTTESVELF